MKSVKINLIKSVVAQNEIGVSVKKDVKKAVFADVSSSGQNEFFKAAQGGLKPVMQASVWDFEYSGEEECEIDGVRYSIYRTFNRSESGKTDLYLERRYGNA